MKDVLTKILIPLVIMAIAGASAAYVKVHVLENDMNWIKASLSRIENHIENKECK